MTGALGQPNARRYFFSFSAVALANYLLRYMYKNEDPKACKKEKEAQIEGKYVSSVAADKIARAVGAKLSERQEYWAGQTIHYALGIAPSALYAVYRHRVKGLHAGWGLLYGLGLFIPE